MMELFSIFDTVPNACLQVAQQLLSCEYCQIFQKTFLQYASGGCFYKMLVLFFKEFFTIMFLSLLNILYPQIHKKRASFLRLIVFISTLVCYSLMFFMIACREAVVRRCFLKQIFLKISQYLLETPVVESLFKRVASLQT